MVLSTTLEFLFQGIDSFLALFIFYPSMVCYWRGIWDLVGVAIALKEPLNHWVTFGIGSFTIFGYFLHPWVDGLLSNSRKWVHGVISRIYLFFFAAVYMSYWRGVWSLGDYYMSPLGLGGDMVGLAVCYIPLLISRTSRSVVFPPCVVTLDTRKDLLVPATCFQVQRNKKWQYVLDSVFTHFVVMTLTMMTWRCGWSAYGAMAEAIWPDDPIRADIMSLLIGLFCLGFLFLLQPLLAKISIYLEEKNIGLSKLVYEDFVYLLVLGSLIFFWRGGWNLNAEFMIRDPLVGGAVNFVVGTILLMSLQLFSYVSFCGCGLDGYETNGEALFPLKYLRVYLLPKLLKNRVYGVEGAGDVSEPGAPSGAVHEPTNRPVYTIGDVRDEMSYESRQNGNASDVDW